MHSGDEDIELCSVERFDSIEPNFLQKNTKIIKKFGNVRLQNRGDKIELIRVCSVRFEILIIEIIIVFTYIN